jgi:Domain of unknown function DUF29
MYVDTGENYRDWELTTREQRWKLESLLEDSPILRNYCNEVFPDAWIESLSDVQEDYPKRLIGIEAAKLTLCYMKNSSR